MFLKDSGLIGNDVPINEGLVRGTFKAKFVKDGMDLYDFCGNAGFSVCRLFVWLGF